MNGEQFLIFSLSHFNLPLKSPYLLGLLISLKHTNFQLLSIRSKAFNRTHIHSFSLSNFNKLINHQMFKFYIALCLQLIFFFDSIISPLSLPFSFCSSSIMTIKWDRLIAIIIIICYFKWLNKPFQSLMTKTRTPPTKAPSKWSYLIHLRS